MELLKFVFAAMSHRSRNSVKSILGRGQVTVEDYIVTQFNYPLHPGQTVQILKNKAALKESTLIGITVMYQDKDVLVLKKDAGLLSVARSEEHTSERQSRGHLVCRLL